MAKIVTITNPLTGQPAQVDQLDHTAQQIDDGLNIARNVSNPNLLDNWYFANCVNQRQGRVVKPNTTYYSDNTLTTAAGTTSAYVTAYRYATGTASGVNYASFKLTDSDTAPTYYAAPENVVRGYTGTGYGIDRWKLDGASTVTAVLADNGITLTRTGTSWAAMLQKIENSNDLLGKVVTFSALTADNRLVSGTLTLPTSLNDVSSAAFAMDDVTRWYLDYYADASGFYFRIIQNNATVMDAVTIKAAKLELGSQQTLAHQENGVWVLNEIPDYGEQLARCQRYQINLVHPDEPNYGVIGTGYAPPNSDFATIFIPTPITLRAKPSIEKSGVFKLMQGYTLFDVTSMDTDRITNNGVIIFAHISGNTLSGEYMLYHWSDAMNTFLLNSNL